MRGLLALISVAWLGCSGGRAVDTTPPPPAPEGTYTRTIVTFHGGAADVRTEPIAPHAPRSAISPETRDPSCLDSSMWMFDQQGFTGNEICFYNGGGGGGGAACDNLGSYVRYCGPSGRCAYWYDGVDEARSWYSGEDSGYFWKSGSLITVSFSPYQQAQDSWATSGFSATNEICF